MVELDRAQCEMRLASGEHTLAAQTCPTLTDWAALKSANDQQSAAAPWAAMLPLVEQARRAHPEGVIEEAWSLQLTALLAQPIPAKGKARAATPVDASRRWPLPGVRVPAPALPPLTDETIRQATDSLNRATERLHALRARLAVDAPEPLKQAAERAVTERRFLLEKLSAALEDALEKDPKFTRIAWLHLAATYFELDREKPEDQRTARGLAMLNRLRKMAPNESASALAGLWLAGFAIDAGDARQAQALMSDGATLDPALAALYEAVLAYTGGDAAAAKARLPAAVRHPDPVARAQVLALQAQVDAARSPLERAQDWESCAAALDEADAQPAAKRARLRAGVAWAQAVVAGTPAIRVPPEQRRNVLRMLVLQESYALAGQVVAAALDAAPTEFAPVVDALAFSDTLITAGDEGGGDALVADLARRVVGDGPFAKANAKSPAGQALRDAIRDRLMTRVGAPLATGRALDEATRARLAPLVEARLTLFPPGASDQISTARSLAIAGFGDRAATIVKKVRDEDQDAARRQEAAVALVELSLVRAREAGQAGEPVGAFLDGAPARPPMSAAARALVDAQTVLLGSLKANEARDALFCDHAAVRIAFGQGAEVLDGLQDIITRREHEPLGLRAGLLVLQGGTPDSRARDAVILVRKRVGPPEREAALRAFTLEALEPIKATADTTMLGQRLFDRAAMAYETLAAKATEPTARDAARLAAATTWAMAFRIPEATAAFRGFLAAAPEHPRAGAARALLAALLLDAGDRPSAAALYEEIARTDPTRAADALAALASLHATSPARVKPVLERLVKEFPGRVPDAAAQLARLAPPAVVPVERPAGAPGRFFVRGLR
jgi:tetratricopeptide (TPR) repeat protein